MLEKNINWNDTPDKFKRGTSCYKIYVNVGEGIRRTKWVIDHSIPIFSKDTQYINKWVEEAPEISVLENNKNIFVCEEL